MSRDTYQGWANYETWLVHLWLTNDRDTYNHWTDQAFQCRFDHANPKRRRENLANRLSNAVIAYSDQRLSGGDEFDFLTDLLNSALAEVDWFAIAEAFLDLAAEQVAA